MAHWQIGKTDTSLEPPLVIKGRSSCTHQIGTGSNTGLLDVLSMDPQGDSRDNSESVCNVPMEGK